MKFSWQQNEEPKSEPVFVLRLNPQHWIQAISGGINGQTAAGKERKLKVKRTVILALYQDCRQPRVSLSATPRLPLHGHPLSGSCRDVSSEHKCTWTRRVACGGKQWLIWQFDSTRSEADWKEKTAEGFRSLTASCAVRTETNWNKAPPVCRESVAEVVT